VNFKLSKTRAVALLDRYVSLDGTNDAANKYSTWAGLVTKN
jgi:hypothetical protein